MPFRCLGLVRSLAQHPGTNQTRLEREIAALTAIDGFGLTGDQLKSIQPMCKESNDKAVATTAPAASDAYRGAAPQSS